MKNNLTPLTLAHEVKENILGYLETTYNIRNKKFSTALQIFLRQNLCHPPYIDIKLPFKFTQTDLPDIDLVLPSFTPYEHQRQAIQRLSSKNKRPQNTIITTGTGSGKSECFFIPIIDHCLRQRQQRGIKAILIYPMNALANDQASRITEFLFNNPQVTPDKTKLPLVSAGMLIGETRDQRKGNKIMHKSYQDGKETYQIIDDRKTMITNPPDILLTNYKMLDYLLMKPEFANLWQQPATLQYLVLDEMHTYDGAQGADVAFLIRRLKAKLNLTDITCVGTSATLVSGTHNKRLLSDFAEKLFGATFDNNCLITENRQSAIEVFQTIDSDLNNIPSDNQTLDYRQYQTLAEYLEAQTTLWFAKTITDNHELAHYLQRHILTKTIGEIFAEFGKPMTEQSLLAKLQDKGYTLSSTQFASYLTLLVHAKKNTNEPLYHVRIQLWLRELRRLLVSLDNNNPNFVWQEDIDENNKQVHLPPVFCEECGEVGYLSANKQDQLILNDINTIYKQYALRDEHICYLFPQQKTDAQELPKVKICSTCAYVEPEDIVSRQHDVCPHDQGTWQRFTCYQAVSEENKRDKRRCPSCDTNDSLRLVASRVTTLSSVINSQLYLSTSNPQQSKKLLVFSDAVQDASHRSGYYNARTYRFNFRTAIQSFLKEHQQQTCKKLNEASAEFFTYWQTKIGEQKTVATFTPSDLRSLPEYHNYFYGGDKALLPLLKKRIAWEFYLEYSLRSQVGRTLEKTLCSAIFIDTDLAASIDNTYDEIASNYEVVRHNKQQDGYRAFVLGIIKRLLMKGGIGLDIMQAYRHEENTWRLGKNNRDQRWLSNLPRGRMQRGSDTGALPKFLSTNSNSKVFERIHAAKNNSNWHSLWLMKIFDWQGVRFNPAEFHHLYTEILRMLSKASILHKITNDSKGYSNFGIDPQQLALSTEVIKLQCGMCYHKLVVAQQQLSLWQALPCLAARCAGNYQLQTEINAEQQYYRRIYEAGEVERIFAYEHTGLLGRKQREKIEAQFKSNTDRHADAINLLSCTPTLEMGIDIGDLSATVVASLPPSAANYQQQVGRAGRKSGASLIVAIAQAKPRDLLHFQEPQQLIAGNVQPPGCFLNAVDLLRRQVFAYLFDTCFEQIKGNNELTLQTLHDELLHKLNGQGVMLNLQNLLDEQGESLLQNFHRYLHDKITDHTWQETQNYFLTEADNIVKKLRETIDSYDRLLAEIKPKLTEVEQEINKLTTPSNLNDEQTAKLRELRRERAGLQAQKQSIGGEDGFFAFLTRNSFLPNYAFQEQAVELVGVIIDNKNGKKNFAKETFERPAKMALREFAPGNTFYGGGYKMQIDRLNIGTQKKTLIEAWRACKMCGYLAPYRHDERTNCPKCDDHMWSDEGQKLKMLKVTQMVSVEDSLSSHIGDEADERDKKIFRVRSYFDIDKDSIQKTLAPNNDFAFGIQFLSRMKLREINFGEEKPTADYIHIAGDKHPRGFVICNRCGRLQKDGDGKPQHTATCPYRKHTTNIDHANQRGHEQLVLFRELHSEAIRVLLPVSEYDSEIRVASIKAALMLGFQEKFAGKPLHLEIEEQKVIEANGNKMPRRYLVMFDAVPGGTGFLRDLWNKDSFFELVEKAYQKIINCACRNDPARNGCLHCVFSGISQFEIPQVKRNEAEKYLHSILENKDFMHETRINLEDVRIDSVLDSDLEHRFFALLKKCATGKYHTKEHGIEIKDYVVIDKYKLKFSIKYGDCQRQYTMSAQQPLSNNRTVCDFIFKPEVDDSKTFALYLDGFEYHASVNSGNRFQTDFAKRQALSNGEGVEAMHVWNLTWQDLNDFENPSSQRSISYLGQKISAPPFNDNHFLLLLKLLAGYRLQPRDYKDLLDDKCKKIKLNENFINNTQSLETDTEIINNINNLASHDPEGLLHALYVKDNRFLLAYLINRETKARTTLLSIIAPLADRTTDEFFQRWQSFLHTWNITQMFSDQMISKVWAEGNVD